VTTYVRAPGRPWRRGLGMVVLLDAHGETVVLHGGAVLAWDLLDQPVSADGLVDDLAALTRTDRSVIQADVVPLLAHLAAVGALEVSSP
jgi:hypothetical protein